MRANEEATGELVEAVEAEHDGFFANNIAFSDEIGHSGSHT